MQTQTLSAIISWPSKRPVDCADPSWQQTYRFTHALRVTEIGEIGSATLWPNARQFGAFKDR